METKVILITGDELAEMREELTAIAGSPVPMGAGRCLEILDRAVPLSVFDFDEGALLVLRFPRRPNAEPGELASLAAEINASLADCCSGITVLATCEDLDVTALDAARMAELGWVFRGGA